MTPIWLATHGATIVIGCLQQTITLQTQRAASDRSRRLTSWHSGTSQRRKRRQRRGRCRRPGSHYCFRIRGSRSTASSTPEPQQTPPDRVSTVPGSGCSSHRGRAAYDVGARGSPQTGKSSAGEGDQHRRPPAAKLSAAGVTAARRAHDSPCVARTLAERRAESGQQRASLAGFPGVLQPVPGRQRGGIAVVGAVHLLSVPRPEHQLSKHYPAVHLRRASSAPGALGATVAKPARPTRGRGGSEGGQNVLDDELARNVLGRRN